MIKESDLMLHLRWHLRLCLVSTLAELELASIDAAWQWANMVYLSRHLTTEIYSRSFQLIL